MNDMNMLKHIGQLIKCSLIFFLLLQYVPETFIVLWVFVMKYEVMTLLNPWYVEIQSTDSNTCIMLYLCFKGLEASSTMDLALEGAQYEQENYDLFTVHEHLTVGLI